jgi:MoaA/NifB/PqqE/SkfB family radical SAM enzyme
MLKPHINLWQIEVKKLSDVNYSKKELDIITKLNIHNIKFIKHINTTTNMYNTYTFSELDENIINFNSWKCNAGIDRLYIHVDGNIYPC